MSDDTAIRAEIADNKYLAALSDRELAEELLRCGRTVTNEQREHWSRAADEAARRWMRAHGVNAE